MCFFFVGGAAGSSAFLWRVFYGDTKDTKHFRGVNGELIACGLMLGDLR